MDSVVLTSETAQEAPRSVAATVVPSIAAAAAASDEIRKMKRRQYQQKRRQSVANKELSAGVQNQPVNNVMGTVPSAVSVIPTVTMNVQSGGSGGGSGGLSSGATTPTSGVPGQEANSKRIQIQGIGLRRFHRSHHDPNPHRFASVDCSGASTRSRMPFYSQRNGSLKGSHGSAFLPGVSHYNNTRLVGDAEPVAPTPPVPAQVAPPSGGSSNNQREFYHLVAMEPAPPTRRPPVAQSKLFHAAGQRRRMRHPGHGFVSISSPECVLPEPVVRFPDLRFIDLA